MYAKNGVDLFEKIAHPIEPHVYTELAALLFRIREYEEAIIYAKKGLAAWDNPKFYGEHPKLYKYKVSALNTFGSSFFHTNHLDSASIYLDKALQLTISNRDSLLEGTVLGNIG